MKKYLYGIGFLPLLLFIWISVSYEKAPFVNFDERMSDLLFGQHWLTAFHYIGDTVFVMIVTIIVVLYFAIKERNYRASLLAIFTIAGGTVINQVLKRIYERPRPDIVNQLDSFSFPSGHSMLSVLYLLTLAYLLSTLTKQTKVKITYFVIATILFLLIGMSRVAEARHYATDVLGGWSLGIVWFTICVIWFEWNQKHLSKSIK